MNIVQLINKIKEISLNHKTVNSCYDGDVYDNWNSSEINYPSVNIGLQNIRNNDYNSTFSLILYYGDRLLQDKSNVNSVITDGVNTLQSVVNNLNEIGNTNIEGDVLYTPFEQKFNDYLAGVYVQLNIQTDNLIGICSMEEESETDESLDDLKETILTKINEYMTQDETIVTLLNKLLENIMKK